MIFTLLHVHDAARGSATFLLALALTYGLHALLWSALAALVARWTAYGPAWQHTLWKLALFAPFVSVAAALASPHSFAAEVIQTATVPAASALDGLSHVASAVGGCVGALGTLRLLGSVVHLRRLLRVRAHVTSPAWLERLEVLARRANVGPVRLSHGPSVGSPLIVGRAEICVPTSLLCELDVQEIDAVLAHELAHLERGDGTWFALAGAVQLLFWFVPTNRWVAGHFRDTAELACDDRAVELTHDARGLARALTAVATSLSRRTQGLVPTMGRPGSPLLARVRRLLAGPPRESASGLAHWGMLMAFGSLMAGLCSQVAVVPLQVAAADPPDSAAWSERVHVLMSREREVDAELSLSRAGSPAALALEQELRHLRATEVWLEQRFVAEWNAAEGRASGAPR